MTDVMWMGFVGTILTGLGVFVAKTQKPLLDYVRSRDDKEDEEPSGEKIQVASELGRLSAKLDNGLGKQMERMADCLDAASDRNHEILLVLKEGNMLTKQLVEKMDAHAKESREYFNKK